MKIPHKYVALELPVEQEVIVPSTKSADKLISEQAREKRVKEVKKYLAQKFGGFTSAKESGGYYSDKKRKLIQEPVTVVQSYATKGAYHKNKGLIVKQVSAWAKKWGQESVGYEIGGDLFYVKAVNEHLKNHIRNMRRRK
jgi:hypothetical protein